MKAMIVVNPSSGSEQAEEFVTQLETRLREQFKEIVTKETQEAGDAEKFSSQAALEGYDAIFLMGGDGTINEGINGIAKQDYHPLIGIIPLGTINNFARVLGISMNAKVAINQLDFKNTKKVDIGKVNDLFFVSTVSVGSIPETVQHVDDEAKSKLGPLAYVMEGVKALNDDETSVFRMKLDGDDFEGNYSMLVIGLSKSVSGIGTVFSSAEIDDGYLYMLCLKKSTAVEKMKLIPELLRASDDYSEKLVLKKFKLADLKSKEGKEFTTTVDGNKGPKFPVHLEVYKQLLTVYVPKLN